MFPTIFDAITRSVAFISQAMVYQPNWNHLDEEGGCCMLYMVAHDLNIDKEIQWPIMENINQKLYAKYLSKLLFSKVEDDPQENINR